MAAARRLGRQNAFSAHLTVRLYTCGGRHTAWVRALRGAAVESGRRHTIWRSGPLGLGHSFDPKPK
eukprot:1230428-Prymnesium_polylepis.1